MSRPATRRWPYTLATLMGLLIPAAIGHANQPECLSYGVTETKNWCTINAAKTICTYSVTVNWACSGGIPQQCIVCETDTLCKLVGASYLPSKSIHTQDLGTCGKPANAHTWFGTFWVQPGNSYEIVFSYKGFVPKISECDDPTNWLVGTRTFFTTK